MTTPTQAALQALAPHHEVVASTLSPSLAQRAVDGVSRLLAKRTSRRGFLLRAGLVGSAMAVDPFGYVLRPGTAYAAVCGPGSSCTSGWTVFCATINKGVNACPPGSIAAGWWKADGASLCGGSARYIVDCNATCSRCSSPGARAGICSSSCWSCSCRCGPTSSCDRRKVCCNAFRYGQCNTQVRQVGGVQCRVVSCTPPWKFDKCTTSPATDNRTRDHNSDALPQAWTRITSRYKALGENGSVLRASVYAEIAVSGGRYQRYQSGRISDSSRGTWETVGPVSVRYAALGAETGLLGFPIAAPLVLKSVPGRASRFVNGRITYHPVTGAWETVGPINARYEALQADVGPLAYPIAAPLVLKSVPGRATRFQKGRITYHPVTGAWETVGPINARYEALQADVGPLAYPIGPELSLRSLPGKATRFQKGRITYHPVTGAWETVGAIDVLYEQMGADVSALAYPITGTTTTAGGTGTFNSFQKGRISAHPTIGAFATLGPIADAYVARGAEGGRLGFPMTAEQTLPDGRRQSTFERGVITHDPATGLVDVTPPDEQPPPGG